MNAIDVVKAALSAVESGQSQKYADMLSDDMVFTGPVPQPIGKMEFVGLQDALVLAMPDWKFNATDYKPSGDQVTVTFQITGTQTGELVVPMMGNMKYPATGKRVSIPKDPTTFTVRNDKITKIETVASPNTGVPAILSQLGIPMPTM